jgi:hypothetical protein
MGAILSDAGEQIAGEQFMANGMQTGSESISIR